MTTYINGNPCETVKVDALIVFVDDVEGASPLDLDITMCAGTQYHNQLAYGPGGSALSKINTVLAKKKEEHKGLFEYVLYAFDDEDKPLHELICRVLYIADRYGFKSVILNLMRMDTIRPDRLIGKTPSWDEKALRDVVLDMKLAIDNFHGRSLTNIIVMTDKDVEVYRAMTQILAE